MLKIGAASIIINGGSWVQGAGVLKNAQRIRDNLEANALYIASEDEKLLLISCDMAAIPTDTVSEARDRISESTNVPARNIIIAGTHTHSGPSVLKTSYKKPIDKPYLDRLINWLAELSETAVSRAVPGKIGWGKGNVQVGYNRRCCWTDGTHSMHWTSGREDFTGLEGPDDPEHTVIATVDDDDKLIAILQNNTSHPTCFYGADFFSADFPGASRTFLRNNFGQIPVLFFNGAFGDISNENQCAPKVCETNKERKMLRLAHLLTGETLRLLHEMSFCSDPVIKHQYEDMQIPVRLPLQEQLERAEATLKKIDAGEEVPAMEQILAWGTVDLNNRFKDNPYDTVPVHVIRIGELAIVTQPCELYCQFGLNIKRRSPFAATAVFGIADGYNGYCPSIEGIMGGGYSGIPISWTRLSERAGYLIVDTASKLLREI
jgi:hypothetical protein